MCFFADAAGDVIKYLMEDCNVHTILRLPNGNLHPLQSGRKGECHFLPEGHENRKMSGYTTAEPIFPV